MDDIEELRRRVANRKKAAERQALKAELAGRNRELDTSVVWLSVDDIAAQTNIHKVNIRQDIRYGILPASKVRRPCGKGVCWAVHPADAERYVAAAAWRKIRTTI